jgi:hypothetical protein
VRRVLAPSRQSGVRVAGQLARLQLYVGEAPHIDLAGGASAEEAVVVAVAETPAPAWASRRRSAAADLWP